jgi:hypothetical protein
VLHFRCPRCATVLRAADDKRGTVVTCHHCLHRLRAPETEPEDEDWTKEEPAPRHHRRRRRRVRRGSAGGVPAWLGWVIAGVTVVALNVVICCGYFGWIYVKARLHAPQAAEPEEAVLTVPAALLLREYQADPAAADARYKDRLVEVAGILDEVHREGRRSWRLVLRADGVVGPLRVECLFSDVDQDEADDLGQLEIGEQVGVRGRCSGRQQHVRLRDCELTD